MRFAYIWVVALLAQTAWSAELTFNFNDCPPDKLPSGFRSTVAGQGGPGEWKVIMDEVAPLLEPRSDKAPVVTKRAVLAQLARYPVDVHFPILIYDGETFSDFKLATKFKIVGGAMEQMAGIVFRFQNESNFYVVRASGLGKNFRCYKVENGLLAPPFGPEMEITKGEWHELSVQCEGTRITCALDGKEAIKLVENTSASSVGKIGFWTKSDSVSYFGETKITYVPKQMLAQTLVQEALKEYPRVLDLAIYSVRGDNPIPAVVGSKDESNLGKPGGKTEQDVIAKGNTYFTKGKGSTVVTIPLHDRNGEPIAAVRVTLNSFPGQTEENAVIRAKPIVSLMQARVQSLEQLTE